MFECFQLTCLHYNHFYMIAEIFTWMRFVSLGSCMHVSRPLKEVLQDEHQYIIRMYSGHFMLHDFFSCLMFVSSDTFYLYVLRIHCLKLGCGLLFSSPSCWQKSCWKLMDSLLHYVFGKRSLLPAENLEGRRMSSKKWRQLYCTFRFQLLRCWVGLLVF